MSILFYIGHQPCVYYHMGLRKLHGSLGARHGTSLRHQTPHISPNKKRGEHYVRPVWVYRSTGSGLIQHYAFSIMH